MQTRGPVRGRASEHKPGEWQEGELVNVNQGGSEREGGHANKRVGGLGWVVLAFRQHSHLFFIFFIPFHPFLLFFYIFLLITPLNEMR
jgi:hypothetical protein